MTKKSKKNNGDIRGRREFWHVLSTILGSLTFLLSFYQLQVAIVLYLFAIFAFINMRHLDMYDALKKRMG